MGDNVSNNFKNSGQSGNSEDVGVARLGVGVHLRREAVNFAYTVVAVIGEKEAKWTYTD
ncbi:MAG: hypothetical protein KF868_11820 [Acidobacteria bacterium]|nr:hypothetical protein [Acidobacteriota bacterium]MCW5968557.1 hypothetical protein [Blastocatellales bacterium]